ncbi:MAG: septum formation initiator family protein [Pseudomonadota bacterium]
MTSKFAGGVLSALILYFAIHTFAGEQGLNAWSERQIQAEELEAELSLLRREIAELERDIERLTPGTLDPDFIEALAREKLAFVRPDEIVITQ